MEHYTSLFSLFAFVIIAVPLFTRDTRVFFIYIYSPHDSDAVRMAQELSLDAQKEHCV